MIYDGLLNMEPTISVTQRGEERIRGEEAELFGRSLHLTQFAGEVVDAAREIALHRRE